MPRLLQRVGIVVLGISLAGCGGGGDGGAQESSAAAETSSAEERDAITFVREEEKLARDVYGALLSHGTLFVNIQRSEQTHMDAVLTLLERHGIPDPAAGAAVGAFRNRTLQTLHDDLVARGTGSQTSALTVGMEIEELDIHDIEALRAAATHADVLTTFDNLTRGSRNHLRSFHSQLAALGGEYVPRHLDRAEFDAIVGSAMETGSPWR